MPVSSTTYFRLYYMASMVSEYARLNNRNAKLVVLLPEYPPLCGAISDLFAQTPNTNDAKQKLEETFSPAISSKFIEVQTFPIDVDECNKIYSTITTNGI